MILQSEIIKISKEFGVPPDTIDKDWVLGHFIANLYRESWATNNLVFKGGTCLKKCFFEDYRFSEDLDFTLVNQATLITDEMLHSVCNNVTKSTGILFSKAKVEPIVWNEMNVGVQSFIRYWGANHKRNQQPIHHSRWLTSIKIEIISYEKLVNGAIKKNILGNYSDINLINNVLIPCYTITEILAEKFRALLQRSYPAPRDYFDIWMLLKSSNEINLNEIISIFKIKCNFKNVHFNSFDDFFNEDNIKKAENAWYNSLQYHLREGSLPNFREVINNLKEICASLNWH